MNLSKEEEGGGIHAVTDDFQIEVHSVFRMNSYYVFIR